MGPLTIATPSQPVEVEAPLPERISYSLGQGVACTAAGAPGTGSIAAIALLLIWRRRR